MDCRSGCDRRGDDRGDGSRGRLSALVRDRADSTWFGGGPTSGERQLAALLTLVGASIFAAGPVGVWLLRRRCVWLRVGLACLGLGFMGAIGVLTG